MWNPSYDERVGSFMISQDAQNVVFLGAKYHYILNDNTGFVKKLLFSQYHYLMSIIPSQTKINLSDSNDVRADITVRLNVGNLVIAEQYFTSLGFTRNDDDEAYSVRFTLFGKRYLANYNLLNYAARMNRQYDMKVYTEISESERIEKIALTPITATIDATLLLGKILLTPLSAN